MSRIIGDNGLGVYSYTYSIAYYFMLFVSLGVNNYGNRSIAQVRKDKQQLSETFWGIYYFQILCGIIVISGYFLFVNFFVKENQLIYYLQVFWVLSAAIDINWFCFGIEKFKLSVIRNTVIKVLSVACIFIFVKTEADLLIYTFIMSFSTFLSQAVIWPFVIKNINFVKFRKEIVLKHIKPNVILFLPVIAVSLYKIMDRIMLGILSDYSQVGLYTYAENIANIPVCIITALGTVMLPRVSFFVSNNDYKAQKDAIENSMLVTCFLGFSTSFGLAGIADTFVPFYLGDKFAICGSLVKWLTVTVPFVGWANVIRTQYLLPMKKDRIYTVSVLGGAIVNMIVNAICIPKLQAVGAIIGTIISEIIVCLVQTFYAKKQLTIKRYLVNGSGFFISGIIMYIIVKLIAHIKMSVMVCTCIQVCCGGFVYLVLSFIWLKVLNKFQRNSYE